MAIRLIFNRHHARRRRCSARRRPGAGVDGGEGRCQPCKMDFRYLGIAAFRSKNKLKRRKKMIKVSKVNSSVNFVDQNNTLIGYDMSRCCCENADWFISEDQTTKQDTCKNDNHYDLSEYSFCRDFGIQQSDFDDLDEGDSVVVKMIAANKEPLYLHIYNCHNGYYGHKMEYTINGVSNEMYL
jgi:hypothetical protein